MSMPVITYNEVIALVRTFVKANCKNWSDDSSFTNLNAAYKAGYTGTATVYAGSSSGGKGSKYQYVLTANGITAASYSGFETDMNNFCTSLSISNRDAAIPASEFLNFINDMVSFCSARVRFMQSSLVTGSIIVYYPNSVTYSGTVGITTSVDHKITSASDVLMIMNSVLNVLKQNLRCMTCQYSITLAST